MPSSKYGFHARARAFLQNNLAAWAALMLVLLGGTASAACVAGTQRACTNEFQCPGTSICDGSDWSDCGGSSTCNQPPPMTLSYVTSGIGAGRERQVDGIAGAPTTDSLPTYLFRQAQKSLTFTATAADPARGVTSVKLQGTLHVVCMQQRSNVLTREDLSSQTFTFSNQNSATTTASSRTVSLSVNFNSYAEETRCTGGYLPYRQDFSVVAEATDGHGGVLKTPLRRYVFVQSFKVATFNVLNGSDTAGVSSFDRLAQHMSDRNDIDVVMLQEASENTVWSIAASPYIKELARQVRFSGNGDLAVMSKFPISQNVPVPFSQPLSGYDHRWHYVVMDLGGFPVKVANLHLIAGSVAKRIGLPEVSYRRQEVDEVMAYMRNPGMPAIIGGDMNADVFRPEPDPLFTYVRIEFEFFYNTPPYKHFCLPPSTGCHVTPETPPRFNGDHLWVWVSTPGFGFVDSYTAYDKPLSERPFLSDHRMQVTRLYINE